MAAELRWVLLAIGALFLAGLAVWEWRRPRHATRKGPTADDADSAAWRDTPIMRAADDGALDIPQIRPGDPRRDPPIVLLDEMHAGPGEESVQVALEVAVDRPYAADAVPDADVPSPLPAEPVSMPPIQWPPERQDRVLWMRVVPAGGGRFGGRVLRQALMGCGLLHGPQDIFHWVNDTGRVIASVANLVRPGNFDPQTMDARDYPGLNVFAVLPGPLPPVQTYDELLGLARDLAARLTGEVRDERGGALDPARIEQERQSLRVGAAGVEADDGAGA
jgi:ZipA, C-terminal FtsZ-binding domain